MKKLLLVAALLLTFGLTACGGEEEETVTPLPETMDDINDVDDFLGRDDVQYVDVRDFDEKMSAGYIRGFENVAYFDYLKYQEILVDLDGDWTFDAGELMNSAALEDIFDSSKTIFIMCGSGTRAGYIKEALESLDYDVVNIGGFGSYSGDFAVLGDDNYVNVPDVKGDFTPGTYYGFEEVEGYMVVVTINAQGGIENVILDAVDGDTTKQNLKYDYGMGPGEDGVLGTDDDILGWFEHANLLADYLVANQGWDGISFVQTALADLGAHGHLIEMDTTTNPDDISGVTIGVEGFVFAWNEAISQASDSDLGVVATETTYADFVAANTN